MKTTTLLLIALLLAANSGATLEEDIVNLINAERAVQGRAPLSLHPAITKAAQLHSEDMLRNGYFSHTSLDGRNLKTRMNNAGFSGTFYGENIAYHSGAPSAAKVFSMWKNSPGHYSNMMNSGFNLAGVGIASGSSSLSSLSITMYTLDLGKGSGAAPAPCTSNSKRSCGVTDIGSCQLGSQTCVNGVWSACQGAINPISEKCANALDDDCDGIVDENCVSCVSHDRQACVGNDLFWYNSCNARQEKIQTCNLGCSNGRCITCIDSDKDGFGIGTCTTPVDCNDLDASINPSSIEICNQKDDNCNGKIDENCVINMKVFSPTNKSYDSRRVLLNVSLNALGDVSYSRQQRWTTACRNVKVCNQHFAVLEGNNTIQIRNGAQIENVTFFVDSRKPQIIKQEPQSMQPTNGTFIVSYTEDNLKNVTLFIASEGSEFKQATSKNNCPFGRSECSFAYNLSKYDNKTIAYYFSLSDGVSIVVSKQTTVIADTRAPQLNMTSFKKTNATSSITYQIDVAASEPSSISYESSEGARVVCNRCEKGHINLRSKGSLSYFKISATDLAGNTKTISVAQNLLQ